jgi:hypothetical protein
MKPTDKAILGMVFFRRTVTSTAFRSQSNLRSVAPFPDPTKREIEQFTGVQRCKPSHCLFADRCSSFW